MDETLKRTFTDAYMRYEISYARFSISASDLAEAEPLYREFSDAQLAFLQAAQRFARSLLEDDPPLEDVEAEPEPAELPAQEIYGRPTPLSFFRQGR